MERSRNWYIVQYGYYQDGTARYIGPFNNSTSARMVNRYLVNMGHVFEHVSLWELKGGNVISPDTVWAERQRQIGQRKRGLVS